MSLFALAPLLITLSAATILTPALEGAPCIMAMLFSSSELRLMECLHLGVEGIELSGKCVW